MSGDRIRFSYMSVGPDPNEVVRDGVDAERLGFDYVWVPDHLTDVPPVGSVSDAWTAIAYIGSQTKKVRVAPGVTDIQRIHPAKTANIVSTLDHLTGGRVVLGIGAGEVMNTKPYGMSWESPALRIKQLKEQLQVMKLLWSSSFENPVSFSGEFYTLNEAHLSITPVQKPNPLIYIGAFMSSKLLSLIGEMADGWYPGYPSTPEVFRERIDIIRKAAERAGRPFEKIDVIAKVPVTITEDPAVRSEIKQKFKRNLVFHRNLLKLIGAEDAIEKLPKDLEYQYITSNPDHDGAFRKAVEQLPVPDEVVEKGMDDMMAIGSADHCIETLEKFIKVGATHIEAAPTIAAAENYKMVAEKIIPHFKSGHP